MTGGAFFFQANRSGILYRWFGGDRFLFDCDSWFFPDKTSDFAVKSSNNVGEPVNPGSRRLARRRQHFYGILMSKQALGERAVETLHDSLVSVNFRASAAISGFVVFHFFGHASHELAPRVDLQLQLRPGQRATLVNRLKSFRNLSGVFGGQRLSLLVTAGDVDNSQHVFVNFAPTRELVVR